MPLTAEQACGHWMYRDDDGRCICPRCCPEWYEEMKREIASDPEFYNRPISEWFETEET